MEKKSSGSQFLWSIQELCGLEQPESNEKIRKEFDLLSKIKKKSCMIYGTTTSEYNAFSALNRYIDVTPYNDETLVVLGPTSGNINDWYINASYIHLKPKDQFFIATQGPLKTTFHSFWKMIWLYDVSLITNLCPSSKEDKGQFNQYWPLKGIEKYGDFEVKNIGVSDIIEGVTFTQLNLTNLKEPNSPPKVVRHLHYKLWPDHGVPTYFNSLVITMEKMEEIIKKEPQRKVVVHCSAGVGRTGTFLSIFKMINAIKSGSEKVSFFSLIEEMRNQRCRMVENFDQYCYLISFIANWLKLYNTKTK